MLTLGVIITNIKKGQSALQVRDILSKLETGYQKMKASIIITGCKIDASVTTVFLTIPSQSTPSITYDVVLELYSTGKLDLTTKFKVYTNSPGFAYNFAYVFFKSGSLLYPEKYPKEFKEIPPTVRNPFYFIGFDKHVFSSIRYVSEYGLPKIKTDFGGRVPSVKTFIEKLKQIKDLKEETKLSQT
jgi:hypothetical protein